MADIAACIIYGVHIHAAVFDKVRGFFDVFLLFGGKFCHIDIAELIRSLPDWHIQSVYGLSVFFIELFNVNDMRRRILRVVMLAFGVLIAFHCLAAAASLRLFVGE